MTDSNQDQDPTQAAPEESNEPTSIVAQDPNATTQATDPKDKPAVDPKATDPNKPTDAKKPVEAKDYTDFALPEGVSYDKNIMGDFKTLAKTEKLSQETAQKFIDLVCKNNELGSKAYLEANKAKVDEITNDPELGGQNLEKNAFEIRRMIKDIGGEKAIALFNTPTFGNEPALFRFLHKITQMLPKEDRAVKGTPATRTKSPEDIMYG